MTPFKNLPPSSAETGEWIVAYQAEQRKRLKTTLVPAQGSKQWYSVSRTESRRPSVPKNTPASFSAKFKKTLNNTLLVSGEVSK